MRIRGTEYGYNKLAKAIVNQAVRDYNNSKGKRDGEYTRKEVSRFIKSPFFKLLTDIDPDYLLKTLEHKDETCPAKMARIPVEKLAKKYNVCIRTVYRMVKDGRIDLRKEEV